MDAPTTTSQPPVAGFAGYRSALTLVLAYGGVGALQWFHGIVRPDAEGQAGLSVAHWLRDGTLAVPLVAASVYLAARRTASGVSSAAPTANPNLASLLSVAGLFAAIMGAGSLLHRLFPETADPDGASHAAHGVLQLSTMLLVQDTLVLMIAAGLFALFVERALVWGPTNFGFWILDFGLGAAGKSKIQNPKSKIGRRWLRVAVALAIVLAALPPLLLSGGKTVIAQTNFPDQVIHPKGSLLLVARVLDDGWWGYVAPAYGKLGIRPIIEMTEGETLNITLVNEFYKDVSLHVHGVSYGQDSDGTRHSGSFVKPGDYHVYQWRATPGTAGYWHYHDHVVGDDEGTVGIENGFYGGLIVRKPGDLRPVKTFMLVFHNLTINGRQYPNTPTLTAHQGELVEFLIVSYMDTLHSFHLHAHRWLTPPRPGNLPSSQGGSSGYGREDNHILSPGDSFGFMTIAGEEAGPGMWMYHCHVQSHSGLMLGFFQVLPPAEPPRGR